MPDNRDASTNSTGKSGNTKLLIIVVVVAVVIIVALAAVIIALLQRKPEAPEQPDRGTVQVVTADNVEDMLTEPEPEHDDSSFVCEMNVDWNFLDASQSSYNAYVANAVENTRTIYFDLVLEESEEVLYSSPYIPVGMKAEEITLSRDLDAGKYPAVVMYHMVDDDNVEVGSVNVSVTLHVEN